MARKTYIVDISDLAQCWKKFEKRTRYAIKKCPWQVKRTRDVLMFDILHHLTRPDRKITFWHILWWWLTKRARIYATPTAMAMFSADKKKKTAYYLLACRIPKTSDGSPAKIIWTAIQDYYTEGIKKLDLCGANKPSIALFKRGFGGKLAEQEKPCLRY